jgi:putative adenylate-forming enzyme
MTTATLPTLLGVVGQRRALRRRSRSTRDELLAHQQRGLAELRAFARARSPFYQEIHRGLDEAPLEALPTVTKATLMERFDRIVTDRDVCLADVESYLAHASVHDTFRGRYRVAATGGTTGRRGIFLADPKEWRTVLASYSRAYDWAGISAGLTRRLRMAVVSSTNPTHQSSLVGATVASRMIPTLRLDAATPLSELVDRLNVFHPQALVGYASILRTLADEQAAGRLAIAPVGIVSASEVLTPDTRSRIASVFGVAPTNVYAATETAGIASECRRGHLHRYEDLVIAEIVDQDNRPVADGEFGSKLLVTVLFSRTQPLIRYELSDRVQRLDRLESDLPFALLGRIEGREEEVLQLAGVSVHPNVFHSALEALPVAGWQVIEEAGALRILLASPTRPLPDVAARVRSDLERIGALGVAVDVDIVEAIPRTAVGKAPLVRRSASGRRPGRRGGLAEHPR